MLKWYIHPLVVVRHWNAKVSYQQRVSCWQASPTNISHNTLVLCVALVCHRTLLFQSLYIIRDALLAARFEEQHHCQSFFPFMCISSKRTWRIFLIRRRGSRSWSISASGRLRAFDILRQVQLLQCKCCKSGQRISHLTFSSLTTLHTVMYSKSQYLHAMSGS